MIKQRKTKEKICNVTFGNAAAGTIRAALQKETLIKLEDDLAIGPIEPTKKRITYLKKIYNKRNFDPEIYTDEECLKEYLRPTYEDNKKIQEIIKGNYTKIYFWIGNTSTEEVGFLKVINKIEKNKECFIIKTEELISMGEAKTKDIQKIREKNKKRITKKLKETLKKHWEKIKETNHLRIRTKEYTFKEKKEDYFDKKILTKMTKEYQNHNKIIGSIIALEKDYLHLTRNHELLIWRIKELKKQNKINIKGNINKRNFQIKKT